MIILDTNVLSEAARHNPDPNVIDWLREQSLLDLATTTICVAELRYGIARLPVGQRRNALEKKLFAFLSRGIANRIFDFDLPAAEIYGDLVANRTRIGRPLEGFDGLIAAIARSRNAAIATRNVNDFDGCGIDLINPWSPPAIARV
jgi:predicted nucleic acid-binding protein